MRASSQFTCLRQEKSFLQWGKRLEANLAAQVMESRAQYVFYYLVYASRGGLSLQLSSFLVVSLFLSCISLPSSNFQPSFPLPPFLFIDFPQWGHYDKWVSFHVGGSLWELFLTKWDPLLSSDNTFLKLVPVVKQCSTSVSSKALMFFSIWFLTWLRTPNLYWTST